MKKTNQDFIDHQELRKDPFAYANYILNRTPPNLDMDHKGKTKLYFIAGSPSTEGMYRENLMYIFSFNQIDYNGLKEATEAAWAEFHQAAPGAQSMMDSGLLSVSIRHEDPRLRKYVSETDAESIATAHQVIAKTRTKKP